jgi:DNA-binding transcriptional MerR regulator
MKGMVIMKLYKLGEFAALVNITPRALRYLDQKGILVAGRTISNRRFYTDMDYLRYLKFITEKQ